jgi:histidine triad (HIT) family protein
MPYTYDSQNIFARILRGEIPNRTVLETPFALAFHDIGPKAPVHILVIPKGPYVNADHFANSASDAEIVGFTRAVAEVTALSGVNPDNGKGYRIISNAGADGMQEVPHYHVHVLAGHVMGPMLVE